jgi:oligosaccharide translocation protein RFT1
MGELRTGVRVRAEGLGVVAKTTATFTVLLWESRSLGEHGTLALPAFAVGQLAYAVVVLSSYLIAYGHEPLRLHRLPGQLYVGSGYIDWVLNNIWSSSHSFDSQYLRLSVSMTMQSVFKHLLTEGDKFLVSRISPLEDQGAYALASNYGK